MHPAKTGKAKIIKKDVTKIEKGNIGITSKSKTEIVLFIRIVAIKLTALIIDEIPAKCIEKIKQSIDEIDNTDNGTYNVHPTCNPFSKTEEHKANINAVNTIQKDNKFNLHKNISVKPKYIGTKILPNPPIKIGITIKNNIIKP
jgi:hypothetical protein